MKEKFNILKNIFDEENNKYIYRGIVIYLLSNEDEPYKLYKMNVQSNTLFKDTVKSTMNRCSDDTNFYNYPDYTSPDGCETISYLSIDEIDVYNEIKNRINNDMSENITGKKLSGVISNIKGYAIKILYEECSGDGNATDKTIICYSKLTKSSFLEPKHPIWSFGSEEDDYVKEVKGLFLKFNEKIIAIDIEDTLFIMNGYYFEILFKYDEYINNSAKICREDIRNQGLVSNINILDEYYDTNKNIRKLLYKINSKDMLSQITIDKFKNLKNEEEGEKLLFIINDDETISIDETMKSKSIMQILRIYNDETAKTIISNETIFAQQKLKI
ncbi:Kiwa anti-phage protein KwaB-like domain-containing protein [Clostridium butyricum]|uniref:Kiwa anti-phage protein KwaB-like domain-containing protein n=1 Tax=Clostridium butyricum TaxID=1492 RepID=UPI003D336FE3